jgi:hypothetical protein
VPKPNLIRDNVGAYQEVLIFTNCKDKIRVFSNSKKNISGLQFLSIIINSERIRFIVLELHQLERIEEHTISLWPL